MIKINYMLIHMDNNHDNDIMKYTKKVPYNPYPYDNYGMFLNNNTLIDKVILINNNNNDVHRIQCVNMTKYISIQFLIKF